MRRGIVRPLLIQQINRHALPRLGFWGAGAVEHFGNDAQKRLRPRPMGRVVRHIQRRKHAGVQALDMQLLHQLGQTIGQIIQRMARRKIGLGIQ